MGGYNLNSNVHTFLALYFETNFLIIWYLLGVLYQHFLSLTISSLIPVSSDIYSGIGIFGSWKLWNSSSTLNILPSSEYWNLTIPSSINLSLFFDNPVASISRNAPINFLVLIEDEFSRLDLFGNKNVQIVWYNNYQTTIILTGRRQL